MAAKKLTTVQKERKVIAAALGASAHSLGMARVAAHDPKCMELMEGLQVGQGSPILKAWLDGWDMARVRQMREYFNKKNLK